MIVSPADPSLPELLLDARFTQRILGDGDSWGSLGGWTGNLFMPLDAPHRLIVNCAYPGDELGDIESIGNEIFVRLLAPTDGMPAWDAVLLSAGGNDLLGHCGDFVVRDAVAPIDEGALMEALDDIERSLIRFLRIANAAQPGVPVICHTYDHPPVSRRWWPWQLGPWVSPVFKDAGIPRAMWDNLAAMLVDELAGRLRNVAADWPRLTVVETRHRLAARDWRNEIHPNARGYAELARPIRAALDALPLTH